MVSGAGPYMTDADGHQYIDFSGNYTSLVHGHAYPPVVEAVERRIRAGTAWPARAESQTELAELLCERVPSIQRVRFTNSGTEAAILAMHVAKALTGRLKILMARQGFHGQHEATESGTYAGLTSAPLFGGPTGEDGHTLVADYGDAESFEKVLANRGEEIAAVFLEPVQGAGGLVTASADFFRRVGDAARAAGALYVLDEVITFRLGTGGAQQAMGVTPDLTMLGKLIGGGFPVGAIGGRADVMSVTDPREMKLSASGTFNGNPVTTTAGAVAVRELTADRIIAMASQAKRLRAGIEAAASKAGLPITIRQAGSLLNVFLSERAPASALLREDQALIESFHLAGMNHGLYFASRGMIVVSTVMTEALIDDAIDRFGATLNAVAREAE
jgi:glutamate-1-semialdehyde 2,1-aminomutase